MDLQKICDNRILVFDGGMGTSIQQFNLLPKDYDNKDGCNEILTITRPDVIEKVHASFYEAGSDIVETNTFGANRIVLDEYGIGDLDYKLNKDSAILAVAVAKKYSTDEKPRYVAGSIGPGTKLPSLLQIGFDELKESYVQQVSGLIDGGVDLLIIETVQDLLQAKAALVAVFECFEDKKIRLPIIVQVTMEATGQMLTGSDMQTVVTTLSSFSIDVIGLNCGTGPSAMSGHLKAIASQWNGLISVQPNAGLPKSVDGCVLYDMAPEKMAAASSGFVKDIGVNIIGGCCGTTTEHLGKVAVAVSNLKPLKRTAVSMPSVSSLYYASPISVEPKPFIVGERPNANGSKKFRDFLIDGNIDGMLGIAKEQEEEQAHAIDICTAYTGLDEVKEMTTFIERINTECSIPIMIDSTNSDVIEEALKRIAGKPIVNSVNLEDGGIQLEKVALLCRKYGAALVALTIDEDGMAKTAEDKFKITKKLYSLLVDKHGIPPSDIFVDTLTFTLASGDEEFYTAAIETFGAITLIKENFPQLNTILGVSNSSFGLKPQIRKRINAVFLLHAIEAGLDAAIMHAGKVVPVWKIEEEERELIENLVFNRKKTEEKPLIELLNYYEKNEIKKDDDGVIENLPIEEKLKKRILDGNKNGVEEDLIECLKTHPAIEIINTILLEAMKTVGELFGKGEMQLPFVLQSAEAMKASVKVLEPYIEKKDEKERKTSLLLATVMGDVHDIGKNLVDIILTNNGFEIFNIGIKQPIESIYEAYQKNKPDAIGMSGLLVKSTQVMRENLLFFNNKGVCPPIILGGAALTRKYVEVDLQAIYKGKVFYAKDAFDGMKILKKIAESTSN